ncbi:hypothetical protein BGZ65_005871, partial [Modicella reniformis]
MTHVKTSEKDEKDEKDALKNVAGEVKADHKLCDTSSIDTDVHHASTALKRQFVASRSGADTPVSIDDFSNTMTPRSSLSFDDQDEGDVKQLADDGICNIILPDWSSDVFQPETHLHKSSQTLQDFWHETLAGAPTVLDLPTDRPRPSPQSLAEDQLSVRLEMPLAQSLRKLAIDHDVDL